MNEEDMRVPLDDSWEKVGIWKRMQFGDMIQLAHRGDLRPIDPSCYGMVLLNHDYSGVYRKKGTKEMYKRLLDVFMDSHGLALDEHQFDYEGFLQDLGFEVEHIRSGDDEGYDGEGLWCPPKVKEGFVIAWDYDSYDDGPGRFDVKPTTDFARLLLEPVGVLISDFTARRDRATGAWKTQAPTDQCEAKECQA